MCHEITPENSAERDVKKRQERAELMNRVLYYARGPISRNKKEENFVK
jgi:hypothetical protein